MTFDEFQKASARTLKNRAVVVVDHDGTHSEALICGALGLAGESGEVIELIKKSVFHGRGSLHRNAMLAKEIGDVLWYLSAIATGAGLTLDECAEGNVAKLKARFPDGFTPEAANTKADEAAT